MALVPFPKKSASSAPDDDSDWEDEEPESEQGKMSFLDHLDELRRRIIYAVVALVIGIVISCFFLTDLYNFVMLPMQEALGVGKQMIYTEPTEGMMLYLKIALIAGILIATPAIMTQVWLFVAPGLVRARKEAGHTVRGDGQYLLRGRLRLRALRGVPADLEILRQLRERTGRISPAHRAGIRSLHEAGAHFRRHLPDADARPLPRAHGRDHRAVPDPQHEIRDSDHLHRRRRAVAWHRSHGTGADGGADDHPLLHQHPLAWMFGKKRAKTVEST